MCKCIMWKIPQCLTDFSWNWDVRVDPVLSSSLFYLLSWMVFVPDSRAWIYCSQTCCKFDYRSRCKSCSCMWSSFWAVYGIFWYSCGSCIWPGNRPVIIWFLLFHCSQTRVLDSYKNAIWPPEMKWSWIDMKFKIGRKRYFYLNIF